MSSANPSNPASPTTWSHSRTASASLGSRLITGPKNAFPSGGENCRIGVPTSLPVSASAASVSACSSASYDVSSNASASPAGSPRSASTGATKATVPGVPGGSDTGARSKTAAPSASYSRPTASRPCSSRTRAATRSRRSPPVWPASYSGGKCAS